MPSSQCLDKGEATSPCVLPHKLVLWPLLGAYNAALLIDIKQACNAEGVIYVIVWDNVRFHHAGIIQVWFPSHPQLIVLCLPPYSPFLNPIEYIFFLHGGGSCMIITLKSVPPSFWPCRKHALTLLQSIVRHGLAMPEGALHVRIFIVA